MATTYLFYNPQLQIFSPSTLSVAPGAIVYFYYTGTTTLAPIYSSNTTSSPQLANPLTADSSGQLVPVYLDPTIIYRVKTTDSTGVLLDDVDPGWQSSAPPSQTQSILASSGVTDLGSAGSNNILITGTNSITSFGTSASLSNPIYYIRFSASLTLIYNASTMILPGSANIVTEVNDFAIAEYFGGGVWQILSYTQSNPAATTFSSIAVGPPTAGTVAATITGSGSDNGVNVSVSGNVAGLQVQNLTATNNTSAITALNDTGAGAVGLRVFGSTATTVGGWLAGEGGLYSGTGPLNIVASNATGSIKFASGGTATRMTIGTAGNVTIAAPASGTALTVTSVSGGIGINTTGQIQSTVASGSAAAGIRISQSGFLDMKWYIPASTSELRLNNNTADIWKIGASGQLTLQPSAGVPLTITPVSGSNQIVVDGDYGIGAGLYLNNTNATDSRTVISFQNTRLSTQNYTLGIDPAGGTAKDFGLRNITAGTIPFKVTSAGAVVIAAPGSAVAALSATAIAGSYAATFTANSTSGQSFGLAVSGGTTAADYCVRFQTNTGTVMGAIKGDGSSLWGYNGSSNVISTSAAGNITFAAPSSGNLISGTAVASGIALSLSDGTVSGTWSFAGSTVTIGSTSAHSTIIQSGGGARATVSSAGNWVIAAPSSSSTMTINGLTTVVDIEGTGNTPLIVNSTNASGSIIVLRNSGTAAGFMGSGSAAITGAALADFGISSNTGVFRIGYSNGTQTALSVATTGAVSIIKPNTAGAAALTVNGSASTPANSIGSSGIAFTVDCSLSNVHYVTMTGNVPAGSMSITNMQNGQTINIYCIQDATGGRTLGNATGVKWPGGSVGVLSTAASAVDCITIQQVNSVKYATIIKAFA